jgi:hypothetical protein
MSREGMVKAMEELHQDRWGFHQRNDDPHISGRVVWRELEATFAENLGIAEFAGSGDEAYWRLALDVVREKLRETQRFDGLVERRFT